MGTKQRFEVLRRLERAGIKLDDACKLRRIALTLRRWHELECGNDAGCIERDEKTGKPIFFNAHARFLDPRDPRAYSVVPDRESGALKRLKEVMKPYSRRFFAYVQGDPRGAALYLVKKTYVPKGGALDAYYSNGIAIY